MVVNCDPSDIFVCQYLKLMIGSFLHTFGYRRLNSINIKMVIWRHMEGKNKITQFFLSTHKKRKLLRTDKTIL